MDAITEPPRPSDAMLAALCVELARGAAGVVRAGRRPDMAVDTKSASTDLVTEVDRDTEQWLRDRLARERPGDEILGEEAGPHGPRATAAGGTGVRWLLDPIDGTVNFVLGLPLYAVSVAAEVDGTVVAGAVADPVSGELFRAHRGGGAYLGGLRLRGPRAVPLRSAVVATGFAYDRAVRQRQAQVVARLLGDVGDVRRLGTAALELCYLAAGRVDGYFEAGLHEWDHAAGALVAAEAGCVVSGLRGRPASSVLVAGAGDGLAPELFALLERCGADEVGGSAGR